MDDAEAAPQNPLLADPTFAPPAKPPAAGKSSNPLLADPSFAAPSDAPVTAPGAAKTAPADIPWSDVPGQAVNNILPSAGRFLEGMAHPFIHPVETYDTLKNIGTGAASKIGGLMGVQQDPAAKAKDEATINAIGQYYANRYGTMEGFKEALAHDPVGLMADASAALTVGGGAAARVPGIIGKAGELAGVAGEAVNPANVMLRMGKPLVSGAMQAANYPLAVTTGAPVDTLQTALKAGQSGSKGFLDQMSAGNPFKTANPAPIVDAAFDAVNQLKEKRRADYLASMQGMAASQTQLPYGKINAAINSAYDDVTHGQNVYRPGSKAMLDEIHDAVLDWQTTPNANGVNYHNVDGMDKLKQKIGDIRSAAQPGSPEEAVATKIYNSIKSTIMDHDPNYAAAMGDYSDATDQLKQMKKTLSINPQATMDTTLRKLLLGQKQVDGNKSTLLGQLNEINPELQNMIAGHILHPLLPIGFRGNINAALAAAGYGLTTNPVGAAVHAVASSPHVAGMANYGVGKLTGPSGAIPGSVSALPATFTEATRNAPDRAQSAPPKPRPYFPAPPLTIRRASGGKVSSKTHEQLVARLMSLAKQAKKAINRDTEPLLNEADDTIIHALNVAQKAI